MDRTPLDEDIQDYAQNIVDMVREPLLILDTTLHATLAGLSPFHLRCLQLFMIR
jgi:hypothetical protein